MIIETAEKCGHLLSDAGTVPDHDHLTLGCGITESPMDIGLLYLNQLACAYGNIPIFQYGFFVGTFGPFDLNAIRVSNRDLRSGRISG